MPQTPATPPSGKDSGAKVDASGALPNDGTTYTDPWRRGITLTLVEMEAGDAFPNDGTTYAGPLRRGLALVLDVLLLAFSLWLLGIVLPSMWQGDWTNDYGKESVLQRVNVLMWVVALAGVWPLFALVRNAARKRTLGMRLLLIRPVADHGRRTGLGRAIIRSGIGVFNKLPLTATIVTFLSIPLTVMGNYERRATVRVAIDNMEPIRTEVARQGCQTGSRPAPSKDIAAVDVMNSGAGRCTITMTFARMRYRTAGLSGEKIKWTRDQGGPWICSSDMFPEWLPRDCR